MSDFNPGGSRYPSGGESGADLLAWYSRSGDHAVRYRFARAFARNGSVVDVGCGHGFGALALEGAVGRYVGLDVDREAVEWAQRRIGPGRPWAEFHTLDDPGDLRAWRGFDVALAFEVVEHVTDPVGLLRDLVGLVRTGGRCLLSTPNGENSHGRPELYVSPYHVREYDLREFVALLRECHLAANLFVEYRIDGLDLIGRRALGRPVGRNLPVAPSSKRTRMLATVYSLWNNRLNGPVFWRIRKLKDGRRPSRPFSTILAEIPVDAGDRPGAPANV